MSERKLRLYLASTYNRWPEMQRYGQEIRGMGHEVTSRWHEGGHEIDSNSTPQDRERLALEDLMDIESASDGIVVFTETPALGGRGGRHVETGYALGLDRSVYLVGPRQNVFHYLRYVMQYDNWNEFKRLVLIDSATALP